MKHLAIANDMPSPSLLYMLLKFLFFLTWQDVLFNILLFLVLLDLTNEYQCSHMLLPDILRLVSVTFG